MPAEVACRLAAPQALLLDSGEIGFELGDKPLVPGEAEQIIDAICLAPSHQLLAGKAGIGAQEDACLRPGGADLSDDAGDLRRRAGRSIDVRRPQLRSQEMSTAKYIERQVTIAVVIAVEEAALLIAVQGIVGGIEIKDDLLGRAPMRLQEQIDQKLLDRCSLIGDLVIARRLLSAQLEPVQRRLAGNRRTVLALRHKLAGQNRHHRIMAQFVMINQVFVAEREPVDALADERRHLVLDQLSAASIAAAARKATDQINRPLRRTKQQGARIRGDLAAVKSGHHRTPFNGCKSKRIRDTLCLHRGTSPDQLKSLFTQQLSLIRPPDAPTPLRNPG